MPAHKTVFVAAGVSLFGGYRSDFAVRDVTVYTKTLTHTTGVPGTPVLVARDVAAPTEIAGFVIAAASARVPGSGSTAVLLFNMAVEAASVAAATTLVPAEDVGAPVELALADAQLSSVELVPTSLLDPLRAYVLRVGPGVEPLDTELAAPSTQELSGHLHDAQPAAAAGGLRVSP